MRNPIPLLAAVLFGLLALLAQRPITLSFEVASVKQNLTTDSGRQGALFREHINTTEGTVTLRNVTLKTCLKWAYDIEDPQISGPS